MRSVDEHLAAVLQRIEPLPPFDQPLIEALDQVLCEQVTAPISLPSFDNSAMDGYAVRAADLDGAADEKPVTLPVTGEIAAGESTPVALVPGKVVRIMTGAPMPHGADAVVPIEWTDGGETSVRIHRQPAPGNSIRRSGEDLHAGDVVLEPGTVLGPRQIAVLAAIGRARVVARPRPRVVVLSTGSELREPGAPLPTGQVYDANSFALAAAARRGGAVVYRVGIVDDDPKLLMDSLSDQLVRADLVITSGGVSKGAYDVVKEVLSRLGTIDFREVAMQPGKPQGFGVIGEDETPIFTLPGNPVSSYVSFEVFVRPALRKMMGLELTRQAVRATLTKEIRSAPGKRQFARGVATRTPDGWQVEVVGGHGSHLIADLSKSNAFVIVPEDVTAVPAGDEVDVWPLDLP
jgi:molybdopterin molybdotransferase